MKLQDRLNFEKRDLSYADLHPVVIKNVDTMQPPSSRFHHKHRVSKKANEKEEVVKYMSNLPNYLERGESIQEKALNVGVLDWWRLENWEYNHKQIPNRNSRCSPSSSNSSTFFSTEGSSTRSSRGPSCSPARQQMHQPALPSHSNASHSEGCSQGVNCVVQNVERFQDLKTASSNNLKGSQSRLRTGQSFSKIPVDNRLKECRSNDTDLQSIARTKPSRNLDSYAVASSSKGKMKIQDGEFKELEKLQGPYYYNIADHECPERHKTVMLLLPRDGSENRHSEIYHPSDSKEEKNGRRSMEKNRKSFSEGSILKEVSHAELYSDVPFSCPLPSEVDSIPSSSIDEWNNFSSEQFQPSGGSAKISFSPSRVENLKEKSSTVIPKNSSASKSSDRLDLKKGTAAAVENISPTHRFLMGIGRIGRSSSSKDDSSAIPQLNSKHVAAKSGSHRENDSACLVDSTSDKTNTTSRSQSSPLRRLLDPLLKPKAANSHQFTGPSQKDSADGACQSSDGQRRSSTIQSVKLKLDLKNCRATEIDYPHSQKHGSPMVQALLKVAVKNGFPLFTFAVENNSEILAATMRKLNSSRNNDNSWVYTFFTICEMKKKNGSWLNKGAKGKGKGHGYIPNVVAQMKVSDPPFSHLIREKSVDQFSFREFVLFSVDQRQTDDQTTNIQLNDELAAIIVKFPRKNTIDLINSGQKCSSYYNQSLTCLKESLLDSNADKEKAFSVESEDLFSTTVILPAADHGHGLPGKGEPSPLIQRWISGGLCDCGGWDLGCRVRVLANQTQISTKTSPTKAHPNSEQFELFSQEEVPDNRPVFSLSSFKDGGIFSVEFNSSVSLLQAFSICIAVLNSREPSEVSQLQNKFEENPSEETTRSENDGIKCPS